MPLFRPIEGARYEKDELIALCDAYIHSTEFPGNVSEKEQKISLIRSKGSRVLEFHSRGKGWGNSALNPNCWLEVDGAEGRPATPSIPTPAASSSLYNQRPWQGKYRGDLLRMWTACAVTGCETPSLLTASHIKPVIYCSSDEMVDPYNGILLSKMYDKLFDAGLITFDDDGRIVFSSKVPSADLRALGLDEHSQINLHEKHLPYLRFHRDKIFKG
jgi:hypothetical protein